MNLNSKKRLKRSIISTLSKSRIPALLPRRLAGIGSILMLHRVRPASGEAFSVHDSLEITPDFLARLIERLQMMDVDIVDLDEAARRLDSGGSDRRFIAFTLDDGYRDNYDYARPIFERYQVPYTIYLTTGLPDRNAIFWWLVLEETVRHQDSVAVWIDGEVDQQDTSTIEAKHQAYARLHGRIRSLSAAACAETSKRLCEAIDLDPSAFCAEHGMTWDMVRDIVGSRFGRIEAHTTQHMAVSRQSREEMIGDIEAGIDRTRSETGYQPRHFAYPFGDRQAAGPRDFAILGELPIETATTTIEGVLNTDHHQTKHALPRLTVNGYYQTDDYINLLLRGFAPLLSLNGLSSQIFR